MQTYFAKIFPPMVITSEMIENIITNEQLGCQTSYRAITQRLLVEVDAIIVQGAG